MTGRKYQAAVGNVEKQKSMASLQEKTVTTTGVPRKLKKPSDSGQKVIKGEIASKRDKEKRTKELSDLSSIPVEETGKSGEHYHLNHHSRDDHLDQFVHKLISQHNKETETLLSKNDSLTAHYDLKAKYSNVLNSSSIDEIKEMLATAVRENFELKQELLKRDAKFLDLQLDQINNNLRKRKPCRHATPSKQDIYQVIEEVAVIEKDLKVRLAKTEIDLIEKTNLLREVNTRMVMLEEKCGQLETENLFLRKTHQNCVKSLKAKNEVLEKRCEKTDARRKLERAGLSEEIRECKSLLRSLTRNVNKCAKLHSDARMELKRRHGKSTSSTVDQFVADEPSLTTTTTNNKSDRLTNWFVNTNPKVSQKAMSVWTEYLQRQVDNLEDKAVGTKQTNSEETVEFLYSNKKNIKNNRTRKKTGHCELSSDDDENSIFNAASPYFPCGKFDGYRDVPPSPTWTRICHSTGLNHNLQEMSLTENDDSDD